MVFIMKCLKYLSLILLFFITNKIYAQDDITKGVVLDKIVAIVGNEIIMQSDINISSAR